MIDISVCIICGNEEAVIERCLNSALPVMGELCLVRAIGDQTPDGTVKIANHWCTKHGIDFRFEEYENTESFPHVDNFAAARNLSFSLATLDWCLWLDCDDVITGENAQRILKHEEQSTANGIMFGYRKPDGSACPRERLIRRGMGQWRGVVHEACEFPGDGKCVIDMETNILHMPLKKDRPESHARNLSLLRLATRDSARNLFYRSQEEFGAYIRGPIEEKEQRRAAALATGRAAMLLLSPSSLEERYELLLNFSELDAQNARDHLLAAVKLQPHRREAFAYLVQNAIHEQCPSDAISYFRLMDSLPRPSPLPWSHRDIWHGWGRNIIRVKVLRLAGKTEMADAEHAEFMKGQFYREGFEKYGHLI